MTDMGLHALHASLAVAQTAPRVAWLLASRSALPLAADNAGSAPGLQQAPGQVQQAPAPAPGSGGTTLPTTPGGTTGTGATTTPTDTFPTVLLTALIWSTAAAALLILFLPERHDEDRSRIRVIGLLGAVVPLVLTLIGINVQIGKDTGFDSGVDFEETHGWISGFGIHSNYHLGVDGVSLPLLLLASLTFTVVMLASWRVHRRVKLYVILLLLLQTSVSGVLCSLDYLLFLLFWAAELVPTFLLIAIWGGPGRVRVATRYAFAGAVSTALLLAAVLVLSWKAGANSFDFDQLNSSTVHVGLGVATAGFWLAFAAFAVRLPLVPLHTWLPDVAAEASAPVATLVGGVLLSLGGYGMIRVCLEAFPDAARRYSLIVVALAAVSAVWGALAALTQDDLRRLIAYGAVAHLAVVVLAVGVSSSIAIAGAVLQLVAYGFTTGLLLLLAGSVHDRTRTTSIARLGGLAWQMPRLTALWVFAALSAMGVPFLAGFIGQFLVFTGSFPSHRIATVVVMGSTLGVTAYMLWMLQRVFFGPSREAFQRLKDATTLELFTTAPIAVAVGVFGLFAGRVAPMISNGVSAVVTRVAGGS